MLGRPEEAEIATLTRSGSPKFRRGQVTPMESQGAEIEGPSSKEVDVAQETQTSPPKEGTTPAGPV